MGAALEIVIVPLLLITAIVVLTIFSDLHLAVIVAGAVFLSLLYLVVIKLLRTEHDEDLESPAPGEEDRKTGSDHAGA